MKKWVLVAALLAVGSSFAQVRNEKGLLVETNGNMKLTSVWQHTYVAADTAAGGKFRDTVYSPWVRVLPEDKFYFGVYIDGKHALSLNGYKDTAFNADSMNINIQTALEESQSEAITTTNLGVLIPGSADLDTVIRYADVLARDTIMMKAQFVRSMVVMKDSSTAARNIKNNTYSRLITVYINAR